MPLVGTVIGGVNFSSWRHIGSATVKYGKFLQSCLDFLIIAWVVFIAVQAINRLQREKPAAPPAPTRQEVLLEEIRDLLQRQRPT